MTRTNEITLDAQNVGTFVGELASKYSYTPRLRTRLDELYIAACRSENRYFVLEGENVLAAQTTLAGAESYLNDNRIFVHVDIPTPDPSQIEQARQAWNHLPFRKCFIALKHGEDMQIVLKPTSHYAGKLAREGWTVRELHRTGLYDVKTTGEV